MPSDRRLVRRFLRRGYQRPFWLLVALVLVVAGGRVALTPLVDQWTRDTFTRMPNVRVSYRELSIFSFPPTIVIDDLVAEDADRQRVLTLPRLEVHTTWSEILRGVMIGAWPYPPPTVRLRLRDPWLVVHAADPAEIKAQLHDMLQGLPAAQVEVASIDKGRVSLAAAGQAPRLDCASDLTASLQYFTLPDPAVPMLPPRALAAGGQRRNTGWRGNLPSVEQLCGKPRPAEVAETPPSVDGPIAVGR